MLGYVWALTLSQLGMSGTQHELAETISKKDSFLPEERGDEMRSHTFPMEIFLFITEYKYTHKG
jgi:hypothetical protein